MVPARNFDNKNNSKSFFRKAKKYVLSSLISTQQTTYIKNRFIGEGGRLLSDKVDMSSLQYWGRGGGVFSCNRHRESVWFTSSQVHLCRIKRKIGFGKNFVTWV